MPHYRSMARIAGGRRVASATMAAICFLGCQIGDPSPSGNGDKPVIYGTADLAGCWDGDLRGTATLFEEVLADSNGAFEGDAISGTWSVDSTGKVTGNGFISRVENDKLIYASADWNLALSKDKNTLSGKVYGAAEGMRDMDVQLRRCPALALGIYEGEMPVPVDSNTIATARLQYEFKEGKTFLFKGFLSISELNMKDLPFMEQKGRYENSARRLWLPDLDRREYNVREGQWSEWRKDSLEAEIRNLTGESFQMKLDDTSWTTLTRH